MTAIALKGSTISTAGSVAAELAKQLGSFTVPKLSQVGVGVVDAAGRSVEAVEQAMAACKAATDETLPAAVRFVGAFLLPEVLNYQVARVASIATKVGTTVLTSGGNGMLNAMTFGAPTWLKTARSALATTNETLQEDWSSGAEFLARCLAENTDRKILKDDLIQYVDMRRRLHRVEQQHGVDSPEAQNIQQSLMHSEASLKDYKDYQTIKAALDQGMSFVQTNFDQIITLAEKTADSILKKAENFYVDRIGSFGGKIEGSYKNMGSDAERLSVRNELRDRIATKLKQVFSNEMKRDDVRQNLRAVRSELLESFGAYREGITALSYAALGAAYYTGGLALLANEALQYADGVKDATLSYMSNVAGEAWSTATKFAWDHSFGAVANALSDFWDAITPDMPEFIKRRLGF
jgi:hypothetical protein